MSAEQRLIYHGIPKILDGDTQFEEEKKTNAKDNDVEEEIGKDVIEYANRSRINITVRQVFGDCAE